MHGLTHGKSVGLEQSAEAAVQAKSASLLCCEAMGQPGERDLAAACLQQHTCPQSTVYCTLPNAEAGAQMAPSWTAHTAAASARLACRLPILSSGNQICILDTMSNANISSPAQSPPMQPETW